MPNALLKLIVAVMAALCMSACVTTETGGFSDKKDPHKAAGYSVQAARGYIEKGSWDAAKRHLKTALEIEPHNAAANEALALVFWRTGEFEQAEKHFRVAIDYAREKEVSRIRNNYAAFLYDRKRYADAESQLEKVTDDLLYDGRPGAFLSLGKVRIKLKKYAEAKDVLERANLMQRDNPMVMSELAEVYLQLGDYVKAQNFYDASRKLSQAPSAASLWLGIRLAERAGNKDAAASYALALKNLFPQSEEYLAYKSAYSNAGTEH